MAEKSNSRSSARRFVVPALFVIALMILSVVMTGAGRDYCLALFDSEIPGAALHLDPRAP